MDDEEIRRRWDAGEVRELYVEMPDRVLNETPVKLLDEQRFSPIRVFPGDAINWQFRLSIPGGRTVKVLDYTEPVTKPTEFNTFRCYYAEEFDGLKNAYIGVAGHSE